MARFLPMVLPDWLRECIPGPEQDESPNDPVENVLNFRRATPSRRSNHGEAALALVYQAAEVVSSIEDQARDTEARAHSLCKSAYEKLQLAENRAESAESARRAVIHEANSKLQNASRALKQAQSRITAAEAQTSA